MTDERFKQQDRKEAKPSHCVLCAEDIEAGKAFTCRRCKKSPFCMTHLDTEYKLCPGCATEQRIKHYNDLLRQERGIIAFLRLTQFIFMVSVILFAADRFSYDLYFEVLSANIFHEYLFLWAGASIFCVIVCYILLFLQKQKMRLMEDKIQDHRISSRYMRR